ncbi:hypothetical protein [Deferrisoma camini]|uniref:hypothetical protein n=1 Tax=Deferrisoma camini TaxID=1035120 RepID=UPI00046D52C9|nr:hypothetical protein [Deferrisoma camini]
MLKIGMVGPKGRLYPDGVVAPRKEREPMMEKRNLADLLFSEFLVVLAPILGGLALYYTMTKSWAGFPGVILSVVLFGIACMGPNRIREWLQKP